MLLNCTCYFCSECVESHADDMAGLKLSQEEQVRMYNNIIIIGLE